MQREVVQAVFPLITRTLEHVLRRPVGTHIDRPAEMSACEAHLAKLELLDKKLFPDLGLPFTRSSVRAELSRRDPLLVVSEKELLQHPERDPANLPGSRYPLTCWLDEVLFANEAITWAKSSSPDNHHLLEAVQFNYSDRSLFFWYLAEYALAHHAPEKAWGDVVRVFQLALVLGFQGERSSVAERRAWLNHARTRLTTGLTPPTAPAVLAAPPTPEPLFGRRQLQRLGWVALGCAVAWPCLVLALRWVFGPS